MNFARSAVPNLLLYPLVAAARKRPTKPYKKAAIIKLGKLGDAVLSLGAIRMLLDHFGHENCVVVASVFGASLFADQFPLVEIVTFTTNHSTLRKTIADLHRLRGHSLFTQGVQNLISLQYHRTLHDEVISQRIPSTRSWGMPNSELAAENFAGQIITARFQFDSLGQGSIPQANSCRELMLHSASASNVLDRVVSENQIKPRINPPNASVGMKALGLAPFSGSILRDIPWNLVVAACEFATRHSLEIHLWSPDAEDRKCKGLIDKLKAVSDVQISLIHTPTISSLINGIARVRLVVAAESAPAHLAIALDRPFLGIIGGGHFGWFAPWSAGLSQSWLTATQNCFGCNWHCVHSEPICITRIPEDQLVNMLHRVFNGSMSRN